MELWFRINLLSAPTNAIVEFLSDLCNTSSTLQNSFIDTYLMEYVFHLHRMHMVQGVDVEFALIFNLNVVSVTSLCLNIALPIMIFMA